MSSLLLNMHLAQQQILNSSSMKKQKLNAYQMNGYNSREDYLRSISEENGIEYSVVLQLAQMLGAEDFDGLVVTIEENSLIFSE